MFLITGQTVNERVARVKEGSITTGAIRAPVHPSLYSYVDICDDLKFALPRSARRAGLRSLGGTRPLHSERCLGTARNEWGQDGIASPLLSRREKRGTGF